jgi:hypothetical protein
MLAVPCYLGHNRSRQPGTRRTAPGLTAPVQDPPGLPARRGASWFGTCPGRPARSGSWPGRLWPAPVPGPAPSPPALVPMPGASLTPPGRRPGRRTSLSRLPARPLARSGPTSRAVALRSRAPPRAALLSGAGAWRGRVPGRPRDPAGSRPGRGRGRPRLRPAACYRPLAAARALNFRRARLVGTGVRTGAGRSRDRGVRLRRTGNTFPPPGGWMG